MNIAIIPGATCACIQIKIKAKVGNVVTRYQLLYKKSSESSYSGETPILDYNTNTYGLGPLFYDLTGLEPNTTYNIKLSVTQGGTGIPSESSVKTFTTCSLGVFDFKEKVFIDDEDGKTEDDFEVFCDWFKETMIAVGYNYMITEQRSKSPFNNTGEFEGCFAPTIRANNTACSARGAAGLCGYKGAIDLASINVNDYYSKQCVVHEYRHFLGLSSGSYQYHGDVWECGFDRDRDAQDAANCETISKVTGFARGVNEGMEIYMFYGENAVDSNYIGVSNGYKLLGFFLLKALGLNDITIVY